MAILIKKDNFISEKDLKFRKILLWEPLFIFNFT